MLETYLLLLALSGAPSPAPTPADAPSARLLSTFETCFEASLELHPLRATQLGDHRFNDRFSDGLSARYRSSLTKLTRSCLADARAIEPSGLSQAHKLSREVFIHDMEGTLAELSFPGHLLPVSHFLGSPNVVFVRMAQGDGMHPFRDEKDYRDFIERMAGFAGWVELAIAKLREGMERDVVLACSIAQRTIAQLEGVVNAERKQDPLYGALAALPRGLPSSERKSIERAYKHGIEQQVRPAYAKLASFMRESYLPHCRDSIAWSALPDGRAWYAQQVRAYTTLALPPELIHQLGLSEARRVMGELEELRKRLDARAWSKQRLNSERQVLSGYRSIRRRVERRLPTLFAKGPRADFEIRLVSKALRDTAPGAYYQRASPDGARPGVFYVSYREGGYAGHTMESLFLHEAVPGHHYQLALAQELELPRFRRFGYQGAYIEGWGLYAESLGDELGLYEDPYQQLGRLQLELLRSARLVLDTGIHHFGWSRRKAVEFARDKLMGFGGGEIDRYSVLPAQALSYKLGELRIQALRRAAEKTLGDRFDVRAFHQQLLDDGPLPLQLLERKLEAWTAAQAAPAD